MIDNTQYQAKRAAALKCKATDLAIAQELLQRAAVLPEGELRGEYEAAAGEMMALVELNH